jgi:peptidoglycan/LPS O-acetylase OafA/YrhL
MVGVNAVESETPRGRAAESRVSSPANQSALTCFGRLPALDGVRGLAILAVFLFHYATGVTLQSPFLRDATIPCRLGWSGVDLFFVLSGFLITGILWDTRSDRNYYKNFYVRRSLRIFPIYYLLLGTLVLLTPIIHAHWSVGHLLIAAYLTNYAFLLSPGLAQISPLIQITHLWSLAVEEQFYSLWPMVVRRCKRARSLLTTCVILCVFALVLRLSIYAIGWISYTAAYTSLFCRMDSLALGAALAVLVRTCWRTTIQSYAPAALIVFGALTSVWFLANRTTDRMHPAIATVGYSLLALTYATLVASILDENSLIHRVFCGAWLRTLGKYSYGLYLIHFVLQPTLECGKTACIYITHSRVAGLLLHLILSLAVCIALAWMSFRFIEEPILRLKSRFAYESSCGKTLTPNREMSGMPA